MSELPSLLSMSPDIVVYCMLFHAGIIRSFTGGTNKFFMENPFEPVGLFRLGEDNGWLAREHELFIVAISALRTSFTCTLFNGCLAC